MTPCESAKLGSRRHPPRSLAGRTAAGTAPSARISFWASSGVLAFSRAGFLDLRGLARTAARAVTDYDVRPPDLALPAGKLSGGNQQKLIVAREFQRQPRVLIAAQPTRGVDVGAIEFIHTRIVRARDEGAGVLLVSSELDEILTLSDRILVMFEGRIVAEFRRGEVTERELGLKMGGA